jgi:hypothetical protein
MANGKLASNSGRLWIGTNGKVAWNRDNRCCLQNYVSPVTKRGVWIYENDSVVLGSYPKSDWKPPRADRYCERLLIYCPQTMDGDFLIRNETPTWIFRTSSCMSGQTTFPLSGTDDCDTESNNHSNCSEVGGTIGTCGNPDYVDGVLPAEPPYYWPSCCTPIDFRPDSTCGCLEDATAEWLPDAATLSEYLQDLTDCLPRMGDTEEESEQFVLYLNIVVWKYFLCKRDRSDYDFLGIKVEMRDLGIIRGEDCTRDFSCANGLSTC